MDFTSNSCILGLSPMDDVTDFPFRALCKEFGADVLYTEFISAEGINHDAFKSHRKMHFTDSMRPIGVQIFGADEGELLKCLAAVEQVEPDFIDLNWGCPVRKVATKGAGSGMLKDIPKLLHITESIVNHAHRPVTVKTRIGYDFDNICISSLARQLQDVGIAMLAIHGRTKSQMYSGSADWNDIGNVKNDTQIRIPIYGNGDVKEPSQVVELKNRYGVDGILIGRAAIGNPWIFEQSKRRLAGLDEREIAVAERVEVCERHIRMSVDFYGERTGLIVMKRHYAAYFKGLPNFKRFRTLLFNESSLDGLLRILNQIKDY
ncbi:MAG: tRNA-dihydrouridine synthase [Bacteroidales bacterium]|nr:tRNA-dihydrouridine synthase [Bacteroidales bacterium]